MDGWLLSIILSIIITVLAILVESKESTKEKISYGIRIFIISFVTIYCGWVFLGPDSTIKHEIEIGEAPF